MIGTNTFLTYPSVWERAISLAWFQLGCVEDSARGQREEMWVLSHNITLPAPTQRLLLEISYNGKKCVRVCIWILVCVWPVWLLLPACSCSVVGSTSLAGRLADRLICVFCHNCLSFREHRLNVRLPSFIGTLSVLTFKPKSTLNSNLPTSLSLISEKTQVEGTTR